MTFESVPVDGEGDLLVSVIVTTSTIKKTSVCIAPDCKIHYRLGILNIKMSLIMYLFLARTSELIQIKPQSAAPSEYVNFYGIDRFYSTSDIANIKLGPFICDRLGLDETSFNFGSINFISCRLGIDMTAGEYLSSFSVTNQGYASKYPSFQGVMISDGHQYDFRCIPLINSISKNKGSSRGQIVEILGYGFNRSLLKVVAGDYPCYVLEASQKRILCRVGEIPLNQNFFIKGAGIEKWLYNAAGSNLLSISNGIFRENFWNNTVTLPLLKKSIENTFERIPTDDSVEVNIVEAWKGMFKAPSTGTYRFFLAADDNSELWLSNTSNSLNSANLQKIAYYYSYTPYARFEQNSSLISEYISLEKDQFYLINAFRNQGSGSSHMWVGVEVPYNESSPLKMDSTQLINISYNPIQEVQTLKVYNYKTISSFSLVVQSKNLTSGAVIWLKKTSPIAYDASATEIANKVSQELGWGWCTVIRSNLDSNGMILNETSDLNLTKGYQYDITIRNYRSQFDTTNTQVRPSLVLTDPNDYFVSASIQQTTAPTDPISGSFIVNFNGTEYEILGNSSSITSYFSSIPGLSKNFYTDRRGSNIENHYYVVRFGGLVGVTTMTLVANNLQGGTDQPQIAINEITSESNNLFYSPIPNEFLFTFSEKPQFLVYSSDILGKCAADDCSYEIDDTDTPILESFSLTSDGLSLIFSNHQKINADSIVTINFAGSLCATTEINLPTILCSIAKNPDNSLKLIAGSYRPSVQFQGIGFTNYNASLENHTVTLSIASGNNTSGGSSFGGQVIMITGYGFPLDNSGIEDILVTIGGNKCQVLSTQNTYVEIKTPAKTDCSTNCQFSVQVAGQSLDLSAGYLYDDVLTPKISSLDPPSSSPSQKEFLKIIGTGFGSDPSKVQVYLKNSTDNTFTYYLSLYNITDTEIFVILGGGKIGSYYVELELEGIGYSGSTVSNSNLFKYELDIDGISPTSGSIYGGTKITITGKNFSPVNNQNQVFISDIINNFCDVLSATKTQIICQTRPSPKEIIGSSQRLYLTQRVQDYATCSFTACNFTFDQSKSPEIQTASIVAKAGETVSLTGSNLALEGLGSAWITIFNGNSQEASIENEITVEANNVVETEINFTMPALREGTYQIRVLVENKGWAFVPDSLFLINPIEVYGIKLNDSNLNDTRNGSRGGLMIEILGNGFYNESVYLGISNTFGIVYSISSTSIVFATGPLGLNTFPIYVYRNTTSKFTCNPDCQFSTSTALTSTISSHNVSGPITSAFTIQTKGNFIGVLSQISATLDLIDSTKKFLLKSFTGTILFQNSTDLIISFEKIPLGVYSLNVLQPENGFVLINTNYKTITVASSDISAIKQIASLAGGNILKIVGNGLPDEWKPKENNISVCGISCQVTNFAVNFVECQTKGLLTQAIIQNYNLEKKIVFDQTNYISSSDVASQKSNINDGKLNTFYDSPNSGCFVIFDFGEYSVISLESIKYFLALNKPLSNFYGLSLQASLDNSTYIDLFTMNESLKTGWNTWKASTDISGYRFIKLVPNDTQVVKSRCNIAEIQFFGAMTYAGSSTLASTECNAVVSLSGTTTILPSAVEYREDVTPIVQSLNPKLGPTYGGTDVTLTGSGFGNDILNIEILFDEVPCVVKSTTGTTVVCTTGAKQNFAVSSLRVRANGNVALISADPFLYIDKWSESMTWGGESPPRE